MSGFAGKGGTPKNLARDVRRTTSKSQREITREIEALNRQEKNLISEIKKAAKQSNASGAKIYAKQLAQLRTSRTRLQQMQTQVGAIGMQATTMAAQAGAMQAVANTTAVIQSVNAQVNPQQTAATMAAFQRQMQIMDMNTEALDEFLDDAFDDDEVEEEADEIVQQTLLGIGIDLNAAMADAPLAAPVGARSQVANPAAAAAEASNPEVEDARVAAELEARFAALS
jgi:hypothetical protein